MKRIIFTMLSMLYAAYMYADKTFTVSGVNYSTDEVEHDGYFYATVTGLTSYPSDLVIPAELAADAIGLSLPAKVTTIRYSAFSSKTGLTSVSLPHTITNIGDWAFGNSMELTRIEVDAQNEYYMSENGVLYDKYQSMLVCYPPAKEGSSFTLPGTVTIIFNNAFVNCPLTSVTLPDGLLIIGVFAFGECENLTSINLPEGLVAILDKAFYGSSLTSISFPASLSTLGYIPFSHCLKLTSFDVSEENEHYSSIDGVLYNKLGTHLLFYPLNRQETSFTTPDGVTHIESGAFEYCTGLNSLIISDGVTNIGGGAFYSCSGLTYVSIANSVTNIGASAFGECTNLKNIVVSWSIPLNITATDVFKNVMFSSCILHVPIGTKEAYKAANIWKNFNIIRSYYRKEAPTDIR